MRETSPYNYRTAADDYYDKGFALGIVEGKAEGKAEGEANAILGFLQTRFGRIPKSIVNAVPTSKTRIFLSGKRLNAPTTAAKRSLPKLSGVLYRLRIGTGVVAVNSMKYADLCNKILIIF